MRARSVVSVVAALLVVLLVPPLLGTGGAGRVGPLSGMRMMVPNTPGGGYDITARTAAKVLGEAGLASNLEVFNLPGAGGTVGLGRLVDERGNGKLTMSMGLGVVGSVYTNDSEVSLEDTTPIAKLVEEPNVVVVDRESPYQTIDELVRAWKQAPVERSRLATAISAG